MTGKELAMAVHQIVVDSKKVEKLSNAEIHELVEFGLSYPMYQAKGFGQLPNKEQAKVFKALAETKRSLQM